METKNIILSKNDAGLLEDLIAKYGRIVSFDQMKNVFKKKYGATGMKNRVSGEG